VDNAGPPRESKVSGDFHFRLGFTNALAKPCSEERTYDLREQRERSKAMKSVADGGGRACARRTPAVAVPQLRMHRSRFLLGRFGAFAGEAEVPAGRKSRVPAADDVTVGIVYDCALSLVVRK
jgi:hypothetical protein